MKKIIIFLLVFEFAFTLTFNLEESFNFDFSKNNIAIQNYFYFGVQPKDYLEIGIENIIIYNRFSEITAKLLVGINLFEKIKILNVNISATGGFSRSKISNFRTSVIHFGPKLVIRFIIGEKIYLPISYNSDLFLNEENQLQADNSIKLGLGLKLKTKS